MPEDCQDIPDTVRRSPSHKNTIAGPNPGEACAIERTETAHAILDQPVAANHFTSEIETTQPWRSRGYDSPGRHQAATGAEAPPPLDGLVAPILNPLTRLALSASPDGALAVIGYEDEAPVTQIGRVGAA